MVVLPEISVVIPVRNGSRSIGALLASLAAQSLAPERFEVIVVDNGSHDATGDTAASLGARVVYEAIPNRSRARNAGARAARADLLAFTDADCTVSPHWLEALLECRGQAPLLAGKVRVTTGVPPGAVERFELLWRFSQEAWVADGWAATANLMVERRAFESVGGFDSAYRHIGEDADFCLRAGRAGFTLGYCDAAVVEHGAERALAPLGRRAFFHGYSASQVLHRVGVGHTAWRDLRPLLSPHAALAHVGIEARSVAPCERRKLSILASVTYACRVAGSLWAVVRRAT